MSTILKALRRLESEKSAGVERPLSEAVAHAAAEPPRPRRSRGRLFGALAALVVLGGAGAAAYRFLPGFLAEGPVEVAAVPEKPQPRAQVRPAPNRPPTPDEAAARRARLRREAAERTKARAEARAARAARASAPAEVQAEAPKPANPDLPPAALTSSVAILKRLPTPAAPKESAAPTLPEPAKDPVAANPRKVVGAPGTLRPGAAAGRNTASAPSEPPTPRTHAAAPPAPGSTRPGAAPAPPSTESVAAARTTTARRAPRPGSQRPGAAPAPEPSQTLAAALTREPPPRKASPTRPAVKPEPAAAPPPKRKEVARAPLPSVYVEHTVWHPLAERRVATVELPGTGESVELHEGDVVGPLVVKKIEPSGVYFTHDGVELRRRVGVR